MTWKERFGSWFKEERIKSGMNMAELGQQIGVSEGTISLIENGKRLPGGRYLSKIGQIFGCSIEEVLMRKMMAAVGGWIPGAEKLLPQVTVNPKIEDFIKDTAKTERSLLVEERADFFDKLSRTLDVWEHFARNKKKLDPDPTLHITESPSTVSIKPKLKKGQRPIRP